MTAIRRGAGAAHGRAGAAQVRGGGAGQGPGQEPLRRRSELGKSLAEARGRAERAEAAHRVAVAEAAKAEAEAAGGVFGGAGAEEARQEAEESVRRLLELKSRAADRGSPALGVAFALLCLAGIAAGIFWQWYAFMGAAAALGGAVWALVRADKKAPRGGPGRAGERAAAGAV